MIFFVFREAKRKQILLHKDRKVYQGHITELEDKTNKMMLQKFGRIVDLEKLETVTVNRNLEELKEKLRVAEYSASLDIQTWEVSCYRSSPIFFHISFDGLVKLTRKFIKKKKIRKK